MKGMEKIERGQVWCLACCETRRGLDGPGILTGRVAGGWPVCCGSTMTIDSPSERAALRDGSQGGHKEGNGEEDVSSV